MNPVIPMQVEQGCIYLDNAATSWPKPPCVLEAMTRCMLQAGANPGRSGHRMAMQAAEVVDDARTALAEIFGIPNPLRISFTANATQAINQGLKGLLRPGDHVVISPLEHNSVVRPLASLQRLGVSLSVARGDEHGRTSAPFIAAALRPATRLIVVTHASNVTGALNPIEEIGRLAHACGVHFMVDAAQTAGHFPIDVVRMKIGLLAFPGHKGLMGPQGTGGLYVRDGLTLEPLIEGGTGSQSENTSQPAFAPDRYESGTLNTPGLAGLEAGANWVRRQGCKAIAEHHKARTEELVSGLAQLSGVHLLGPPRGEERAGIVAFNLEGWDCNTACDALDRHAGIAARGGLHCAPLAHQTLGTLECGAIRLSPGPHTTQQEIAQTIKAIRSLCRSVFAQSITAQG